MPANPIEEDSLLAGRATELTEVHPAVYIRRDSVANS